MKSKNLLPVLCFITFVFALFLSETAVATPVVTAGGVLAYIEDETRIVSTNITVTDADTTNIIGATVQFTANYQGNQDVLSLPTNGVSTNITATFNVTNGTLTLTGTDTVSNYQAALRRVTYHNTSENPVGAPGLNSILEADTYPRTVTWTVTDDQSSSGSATSVIGVLTQNDAPIVYSVDSLSIIYGDTSAHPLGFSFVDVDAFDAPQIDFSIHISTAPPETSPNILNFTGFASKVPGATVTDNFIKWTSTIAQANSYVSGLKLISAGPPGYYEITVAVSDNGFTGGAPVQFPNARSYPQTTTKVIPVIVLATVPGGVDVTDPTNAVVASSANSPAGQGATNAIDNVAASNATVSKYLNFDKFNTGLTIFTGATNVVRGLTIISAEDAPEREPANFILEGSLDGTNFTHIANNEISDFDSIGYEQLTNHIESISFSNEAAYSVYRLTFPYVANSGAANSMQISEIELLAHREITSTNDLVSISLPAGAADVRGVARLTDHSLGLTNKLEIAPIPAGSNTVVDITPAIGATTLTGFELIGGADDALYPERCPTNVTISGSIDGTNFIQLTETVVPQAPLTNSWIQEYSTPGNDVICLHYRVTFGPPVSGNRLQLGELRLFGEQYVSLGLAANPQQATLQWLPAAGFALEQRTNIAVGNWTTVTNAPVQNSGTNTVLLPIDTTTKFFRLHDTND